MAEYLIRIKTEPCEDINGVTLADEGIYMSQSEVDGGDESALIVMFDCLKVLLLHATPAQREEMLKRWEMAAREPS